jgi:23S rRNA pseudouridine1911/1915/1917 synthase
MHSAPLKQSEGETLHEWYASHSPSFFDLMHRLDYETHGLVLFAKTQKSYKYFKELQDNGGFVKEYSAVCSRFFDNSVSVPGFPPPPELSDLTPSVEKPLVIESYFRPYGPGRKQVRPILDAENKHHEIAKDKGAMYRTEIISIKENVIIVRLKRGFRHQIRCHLFWAGFPILNDPLYCCDVNAGDDFPDGQNLALRAHALYFTDPSTGGRREYKISPNFEVS